MGRTGVVPWSDRTRPRAARALAVVLATVALLLAGAVDVLPRSAAGPLAASPAAAAALAGTPGSGVLEAPATSLGLRAAAPAGVPAPTSPGGGLPPTGGPPVAPHLVTDPQSRPPTSPPAGPQAGAVASRAPPGPAGT